LMQIPQFWWMKIIFGNKKEQVGAQPWREWNHIKCVCKPSDPDLLGYVLMFLSFCVLLSQYFNQKREKHPLKWLRRNKNRFAVFVLVTVSGLCSWVGDKFETFLLQLTDEVLKSANTPWSITTFAPQDGYMAFVRTFAWWTSTSTSTSKLDNEREEKWMRMDAASGMCR